MPSINLYRNISITFIAFTVILLVAVFFVFSSKATIFITPSYQDINLSFNLEIKENPTEAELAQRDMAGGKLVIHTKSGSGTFEVLSTKTVDSEIVGRVKIINSSNRDQTLVKTTQLQAGNGVIVRTNNHVVVPANGNIDVNVFAKDPNTFESIDQGKLVIIKLNPSLQDNIYGMVEKTLTDNVREVNVLSESDIGRAKEGLGQQLFDQLKKEDPSIENNSFVLSVKSFESDSKVGDEVDNFVLTAEVEIKILEINDTHLADLIIRKIGNLDLPGLEIGQIDIDKIDFLIIEEDLAGSVLTKVNYSLLTEITEDNVILDKVNLAGKNIEDVERILNGSDLIEEAVVTISPYWKNELPQESKIKIIIKSNK